MSLIYITGPTAAGKTTVGEALKFKGYDVYDTDAEGMRHWQNIATGDRVDAPIKNALEDPHWHNDHFFALSQEPIKELFEKAKDKTIFVVGVTKNDLDYKNFFSKIIVLTINEETQADRIKNRTNHRYGKEPHQFAAALKWRQPQIDKYRQAGAIEVDATQPLDRVVSQIINLSKD